MSVLSRSELEASPLADLHLIASELGIDGFRRLRKAQLVDTIVERQGPDTRAGEAQDAVAVVEDTEAATPGEPEAEAATPGEPEAEAATPGEQEAEAATPGEQEAEAATPGEQEAEAATPGEQEAEAATTTEDGDGGEERDSDDDGAAAAGRRPRRRGGRRGRRGARDADDGAQEESPTAADAPAASAAEPERTAEGVVELLGGGSGFVRVAPPEPSDDDVYISAAQIRRCELVDGDTVGGPVRPPRRSERYASLIRVDTINGVPADEVSAGTRYEELPAAYPEARFALGTDDPTLQAIEWLTPFGRGSRVTVVGPARAGKTEALRRLAGALAGQDGLTVTVALAGGRPEELAAWREGPVPPAAAADFAASSDAQAHAVERTVEQARRVAARGGDAVVLVDGLDGLHAPAARKVLAAARNIADGGSLTLIATSTRPLGGETTVIALDAVLTSTGRFPALDLVASGTLRPELLVGEAGAHAIAKARADAASTGG